MKWGDRLLMHVVILYVFCSQETQPQVPSSSSGQASSLTGQTGLTGVDQVAAGAPMEQEATTAVGEDGTYSSPVTQVEQPPPSVVHQLFGSEVETLIECRCGWSTTTKRTELLFSLFYQPNAGDAMVENTGNFYGIEKSYSL